MFHKIEKNMFKLSLSQFSPFPPDLTIPSRTHYRVGHILEIVISTSNTTGDTNDAESTYLSGSQENTPDSDKVPVART